MAGAGEAYVSRPVAGGFSGWPIVGWTAGGLALMTMAIAGSAASGEEAAHRLLRATAFTSVLLFSAAFSASALRRLRPAPATRWLLENRRYLGVSFAVSHASHLGAILWLATFVPDRFETNPTTLVFGSIGFVFVAAMAATSFDASAAWLGPRRWKLLHATGGYYLWFIFFATYVPNLARSRWLIVPVLLLVAVLAVRIAARVRRR